MAVYTSGWERKCWSKRSGATSPSTSQQYSRLSQPLHGKQDHGFLFPSNTWELWSIKPWTNSVEHVGGLVEWIFKSSDEVKPLVNMSSQKWIPLRRLNQARKEQWKSVLREIKAFHEPAPERMGFYNKSPPQFCKHGHVESPMNSDAATTYNTFINLNYETDNSGTSHNTQLRYY